MIKMIGAVLVAAVALPGLHMLVLASPADAVQNGLALTPPMGWNGHHHYGRDVTASIVEAQARAIVSSGMKAAGYTYVDLDGGWDMLQRDAQGQLQPDPSKFPDGIAPLAAYVHSLGLKFGIYTSAGTTNCAQTAAGSFGHYQQDANTFASWGVDLVKVDWCDVPLDQFTRMTAEQVAQRLYGQFGNALQSTGRKMLYSLSTSTANLSAWAWASSVGNMWRTTGDLNDSYTSMLAVFGANAQHYQAAGPGGWNDPDVLEVGNRGDDAQLQNRGAGMTRIEERTEFSFWAEMAAPLIAGNDLTKMSTITRKTLTNRNVIAVDQDPLGRQGHLVANADGHCVLTKPLVDGGRAVVLFNETDHAAMVTTTARRVGLMPAPTYRIVDLWQHTTIETGGTISAVLAPHAVAMVRVSPSDS